MTISNRTPTLLSVTGAALLLLAVAGRTAADDPTTMPEHDIVRVAEGWKNRVFLVVADGGPSHVPVEKVLEDPKRLYRKRRVGCAVGIGGRRYLVTTATLVRNNPEVEVFNDRGQHVLAQIVGTDPYLDIALLKAVEDLPATEGLEPLETAEPVESGTSCMVLGNAFGRSLSATLGTVGGLVEIVPMGLPILVYRVHAPIHPGDAGGPVLDRQGRFLGLVTAACVARKAELEGTLDEEGVRELRSRSVHPAGFAVPARSVEHAWTDLRDFGHVRRGYFGVEMSVADEGLGGARILNVVPESPAAVAGIRPGDLITSFGNDTVVGPRQLCAIVAGTPPRAAREVHLIRDHVEHILTIHLAEAQRVPRIQRLTPATPPAPEAATTELTSE